MRISDWSSYVCSSDLAVVVAGAEVQDMIAVDDGSRRDVGALVDAGVDRRELRAGRLHQRREARDPEVALLVVVAAVPGEYPPLQVEGHPVRRGVVTLNGRFTPQRRDVRSHEAQGV